MRHLVILLWLGLATTACTRPMTEGEVAFADAIFADDLDTSNIRIAQGLGIAPLYQTRATSAEVLRGTERACVRTPQPRDQQPPMAFVVGERMHFRSPVYSSDLVLGWPNGLRFPQALILAHELTHVWQWQNRERTGYSPLRAVAESLAIADPYFAPPSKENDFFDYGFEQQAAFVEDFICFTFANPTHPRREELRALLEPVFPVGRLERAIVRDGNMEAALSR